MSRTEVVDTTDRKAEVIDRLSGKVSKKEVDYRQASKDTKASCAECEYYLFPGNPTSDCRRVAGRVESGDVCDLFVPRETEYGSTIEKKKKRD